MGCDVLADGEGWKVGHSDIPCEARGLGSEL
jgi:hypothetical protein